MTRMTGPDCAVICNLINIHTYIHTYIHMPRLEHAAIISPDLTKKKYLYRVLFRAPFAVDFVVVLLFKEKSEHT